VRLCPCSSIDLVVYYTFDVLHHCCFRAALLLRQCAFFTPAVCAVEVDDEESRGAEQRGWVARM
jgi:methyl coenzyme M reductase subunit C